METLEILSYFIYNYKKEKEGNYEQHIRKKQRVASCCY